MTDKSVIAYSSVWPLARRAIIGMYFPPISWPMTEPCLLCTAPTPSHEVVVSHMVPIVSLSVGFVEDARTISQADWKFG